MLLVVASTTHVSLFCMYSVAKLAGDCPANKQLTQMWGW